MTPVTIRSSSQGWKENSTTSYWTSHTLWDTGSALYAVLQDTTASPKIRVLKADDRTNPSSFTEQDSGNNKALFALNKPSSSWYDPATNMIHVVAFVGSATTIQHFRFDCATDTWTTGFGTVTAVAAAKRNIRVVVRSDGDVLVFFGSSADDIDLGWSRYEGASWSANVTAINSATSGEAATIYDAGIDSTDRAWVYYFSTSTGSYRTVNSANTVSAAVTVASGTGLAETTHWAGMRANMADISGTDTVVFDYLISPTNSFARVVSLEADAASGRLATAAFLNTVAADMGTRSPNSFANVGGTWYAAWWDDQSSGTIFYATLSGTTWTKSTFATGITRLIEIVPVGVGLAVVYQSGSDVVVDAIVAFVPPPVIVNADLATGSALAPAPTPRIRVPGEVGTASGLAQAPTPRLRVPGVVATASGLHLVPTIRELVQGIVATGSAAAAAPGMRESVAVPVATGSALFQDVAVLVGPVSVSADLALATAAMLVPGIRELIAGVVATGSAQSLAPGVRISVLVPAAAGSAAALDPTFAPMLIAGALATASGLMSNPTPRLSIAGVVAAVSALLSAPTVRTRVNVPIATVSGLLSDPGVLVGPVSVLADLASVSGLAYAPGVRSAVPVTVASGVATILVPAIGFRVSVPASGVGAEALPPTFLLGPVVIAVDLATAGAIGTTPVVRESVAVPVATSAGSATAPVPRISVLSQLTNAAGEAFDATTEEGALLISVTLATAAALGISPAVALRVIAPAIAASAAAANPSLLTRVSPPPATATAALLVPAVRTSLLVPASTGSALAIAPTMTLRVAVPLDVATAAGIAPTLRTIALGERMEAAGLLVPPGPRIVVQGAPAAADGVAWDAEVIVEDDSILIDVDLAVGSSSTNTPHLVTRVPSVIATGSAGGLAPQPVISPAAPLSTASLLAYEPRILATVFAPTGEVTGSFEVPSVASLLEVPLAVAGGAMFAPIGRVLVTVPRMDADGLMYDVFVAADVLAEILPGGRDPLEVLAGGRVIVAVAPGGHTATVLSGGKPPARILAGGKGTDE